MNKNQLKGSVKDIAGKVQEQVGKLTGDKKQEGKGVINQALGKVQQARGDVKEAIEKAEAPQHGRA